MVLQGSDPQTYTIIGAAMAVHSELGPGFLERVYQEALAVELQLVNIPFQAEYSIPVSYKGRRLAAKYRVDFICFNTVIVEIKAISAISGIEKSQLLNYLKASGIKRGLLLNFGTPKLEYQRLVF